MNSRQTQPHRRGPQREGGSGSPLSAMLKGAPQGLPNPMDVSRRAQKQAGKRQAEGNALSMVLTEYMAKKRL